MDGTDRTISPPPNVLYLAAATAASSVRFVLSVTPYHTLCTVRINRCRTILCAWVQDALALAYVVGLGLPQSDDVRFLSYTCVSNGPGPQYDNLLNAVGTVNLRGLDPRVSHARQGGGKAGRVQHGWPRGRGIPDAANVILYGS